MNKAHRDRIAFMRICSGKFDAGVEVKHVQGGKVMRLSQPQQIMADERKILDEAYAGDIIGVFDPGIFSSLLRVSIRLRRRAQFRFFRNLIPVWRKSS